MVTAKFVFPNGNEVTTSDIIRKSMIIDIRRIYNLKSTSSSAAFTLKAEDLNNTLVERLLKEDGDITVELKDGNIPLFKGYFSKQSKYSVGISGVKNFDVTVEDIGVRLLKAPLDEHTWNNIAIRDIIIQILEPIIGPRGVDREYNIVIPEGALTDTVFLTTSKSDSAESVLSNLLYEFGYYYYFDEEGNFVVKEMNLNPDAEVQYYFGGEDKDASLYAHNGSAITLKRRIGAYNQASVCYPSLVYREGVNIFEVKNLSVPGGAWWNGIMQSAIAEDDLPQSAEASTKKSIAGLYPQTCSYPFVFTEDITVAEVSWDTEYEGSAFPGATCSYKAYFTNSSGHIVSNVVSVSASYTWVFQDWKTTTQKFVLSERPSNLVFEHTNWAGPIRYFKNIKIKAGTSSTTAIASNRTVTDLDMGKKIWAFDNFTPDCTPALDTTYDILEPATDMRTINVLVNCGVTERMPDGKTYSRFAAKADCWCTDSDRNYVYATKAGSALTSDGSACYNYDAKYITSRQAADALVKRLAAFNCYCQSEYTFFSNLQVEPGSVVLLTDDVHSGLQSKVFITEIKYVVDKAMYEYTGYALSDISTIYGEIGEDGTAFDVPKVDVQKQRYLGEWNATTVYYNNEEYLDFVQYNGSSYVCKETNVGQEPGDEDYWTLVASAGGTGTYKQYSLSSSESIYDGDDSWYDDVSDRYRHNLYVWTRECSDLEDGSIVYGTPYYDWLLTSVYQSQVSCIIVPVTYSYIIDSRASFDAETEIPCYIENRGWDVSSWQWTTVPNDPTICVFDEYERILYVKKNTNTTEIALILQGLDENDEPIEDCNYTLQIKGQDQTSSRQYLGVFEDGNLPSASKDNKLLLDGDCCLVEMSDEDVTWYEPYVYRELINDFEILADDAEDWAEVMNACQTEALNLMQDNPNALGKSKYSYFQNIIAKNITTELLSAQTLTKNYSEDASGAPLTGYIIDANKSEVKIANATFGNCKLIGSNAILDTPALTTSNESSDVESYRGGSADNTNYYNYDEITLPSYNGWYNASGTYYGSSVDAYRGTNASQVTVMERSDIPQPPISGSAGSAYTEYTLEVPVNGTYTVSWQGFKSYTTNFFVLFGLMKMWSTGGIGIYTSGGTEVIKKGLAASEEGVRSFNVTLSKGTIYKLRMYASQFDTHLTNGWFKVVDNVGRVGFALSTGLMQEVQSGWSSRAITSLRINGTSYSFTPKVLWQNNMIKGGSVVTDGAISNVDTSTSTLVINGTSFTGYSAVSWSTESAIFKWPDETSKSLNKSEYNNSFSFSFDTLAMVGYVRTTTLLPKENNITDIGSETDGRFGTIYLINEPQWVSRREYKKDIEDFDERALDAILGTKIKTFRLKTEADNTPKHLGFIADDTNHFMSQEHQGVSTSACIGMLIKAIQELQEEINEMRNSNG